MRQAIASARRSDVGPLATELGFHCLDRLGQIIGVDLRLRSEHYIVGAVEMFLHGADADAQIVSNCLLAFSIDPKPSKDVGGAIRKAGEGILNHCELMPHGKLVVCVNLANLCIEIA
jgi:hypothetical protein